MIYLEPGCVDMADVIQDYPDFTLKLDFFFATELECTILETIQFNPLTCEVSFMPKT